MPKCKPHKGLKKRVRVTARGKVLREMSFGGHLMSGKSGRRRQRLRRRVPLRGKFARKALEALGLEARAR
jgi:large subunit ribosomal protein L35